MDIESIWALYQKGIDFKNSIQLYGTVDKNERFFAGDQWSGVAAPDLPKPVINFIRRACQQKIAEVKANPATVCFSAMEFPSFAESGENGKEIPVLEDPDAELLNCMFKADWERLKMDSVNLDGLQDACISGDYILYNYWDSSAPTGQLLKGSVCVETIDNVNFYPCNPNERDVQKQPGILIARRELVTNVRREAQRFGMESQIDLIVDDSENYYQSGDIAKKELHGNENGKCITLLYLAKNPESGHVTAVKCTRQAIIRPLWDTRLTRYPIAMMNWELRKNCCHGRAEITGLIPAQRYINQMYAMAMLYTMQYACPKPLFNQGAIKAWSTAVGSAVPVNGDVNEAAKYLSPPALPSDAYNLPERIMRSSLEMAGVTDVSLGNFNPNNYSALIAAKETSSVPLETIKARFYSMLEDFARNWLDMILAFGGTQRWARIRKDGTQKNVLFNASEIRKKIWNVKIDVGASTMWSESATVQTLNNLYSAGLLTPRQYIERLPAGYLPMRDRLLREMKNEFFDNKNNPKPPENKDALKTKERAE